MATTQYTGVIPVASKEEVNSALQAKGYGPDNFSVNLVEQASDPDSDAHSIGCSCAMSQETFTDFEAVGATHDMILLEGNFDENIQTLGLKKQCINEETGGI